MRFPLRFLGLVTFTFALAAVRPTHAQQPPDPPTTPDPDFPLVQTTGTTDLLVDPADYPVVRLAANLLADDVARVTGQRPAVRENAAADTITTREVVLLGTLGHNARLDDLARTGRLTHLDQLRDGWETTLLQTVDHPWPGVDRALVIAGSDRRGAAYGAMTLSERIGVSPWYWWADVPTPHRATLSLPVTAPELRSPSVKYRGIFINDEDWGLQPWAAKTFDPAFHDIGPKTYAKVFELMLRLRLNYLWPAMHPASREFASVPENSVLADQYAIVMGSSHCEPMLQNNVWWPHENGPWRYDQNRDRIYRYWEQSAQRRGQYEAVWTEGIRGIHDVGMQGPPDVPDRVALLGQIIRDERTLIEQYVTHQWGPIAQCFIPYKEVQPLYDAGLEMPPEVTLIWADDNYGYLRRVGNPTERRRPGGAGIYYHLSYYGSPLSYLWLDTTPPALVWEETRKAWDNDARTIWVLNVGDIKPGEVGIDFWAHLAWNVDAYGPDAQPRFLRDFATRVFGPAHADAVAALYGEYYGLGQVRKPETMTTTWAAALSPERAAALHDSYTRLLDHERTLAATVPPESKDAWTELAGYPARMLAATGLLFLENRLSKADPDQEHEEAVKRWHAFIEGETLAYNEQVAGGKWRGFMPPPEKQGGTEHQEWKDWAEMHWSWLTPPPASPSPDSGLSAGADSTPVASTPTLTSLPATPPPAPAPRAPAGRTLSASAFTRKTDGPTARWVGLPGLGRSAGAMTLEPTTPPDAGTLATLAPVTPRLEYDFDRGTNGDAQVVLSLLPTFRLYPGRKLRLGVTLDGQPTQVLEVPGSSGDETETGPVRREAVLDNRVNLPVPLPRLDPGPHTLKVQALDPGVVLDEITLP